MSIHDRAKRFYQLAVTAQQSPQLSADDLHRMMSGMSAVAPTGQSVAQIDSYGLAQFFKPVLSLLSAQSFTPGDTAHRQIFAAMQNLGQSIDSFMAGALDKAKARSEVMGQVAAMQRTPLFRPEFLTALRQASKTLSGGSVPAVHAAPAAHPAPKPPPSAGGQVSAATQERMTRLAQKYDPSADLAALRQNQGGAPELNLDAVFLPVTQLFSAPTLNGQAAQTAMRNLGGQIDQFCAAAKDKAAAQAAVASHVAALRALPGFAKSANQWMAILQNYCRSLRPTATPATKPTPKAASQQSRFQRLAQKYDPHTDMEGLIHGAGGPQVDLQAAFLPAMQLFGTGQQVEPAHAQNVIANLRQITSSFLNAATDKAAAQREIDQHISALKALPMFSARWQALLAGSEASSAANAARPTAASPGSVSADTKELRLALDVAKGIAEALRKPGANHAQLCWRLNRYRLNPMAQLQTRLGDNPYEDTETEALKRGLDNLFRQVSQMFQPADLELLRQDPVVAKALDSAGGTAVHASAHPTLLQRLAAKY